MRKKRIIFIQNSWRILDNPLLDLPNDEGVTHLFEHYRLFSVVLTIILKQCF